MENAVRFIAEPGEPEKQTVIDNFFYEVLEEIGYDQAAKEAFCEIRSREIAAEGETRESNPHLTDDRVTELVVKGRTTAIALEIRDDFNYIQVYLAHF
jgi:hypothetical protein